MEIEMSTIQAELDSLQKMSETARDKTAEAEDIVHTQLEAIRLKVKNGASTGDRLYDFTLVHLNDRLDGYVRKVFADLESELADKTGQLFLIAEYSRGYRDPYHMHDHQGGYPMPAAHRSPDILTIGFLSDDKLIIDQQAGTWRIPSKEGPAFFKEDDAQGMHFLIARWGRQLDEHPPQIVAGDEAVLAFFRKEIDRFATADHVVRRDIALRTLSIAVPDGHWIRAEREKLRDASFRDAQKLEQRIAEARFEIESAKSKHMPIEISNKVEAIQRMIGQLGPTIDLAVTLGIDPQRTEILRMRESFGHYWEKKAPT